MTSYKKQITFLIFSVLVCLALIFFIYDEIRKNSIDDLNERNLVSARIAAKGLSHYFDHQMEILHHLSKDDHVVRLDRQGKIMMKSIQEVFTNNINAVTRTDARGRITFSSPAVSGIAGRDISQQEHIAKILRTQKPVVSDIFQAAQGYKALAIHWPVFRENKFDGTIAFLIPFHDLAKGYLDYLFTPGLRFTLLINAQGNIIYSLPIEHLGQSAPELYKDNPAAAAMIGKMMKGEEGKATYIDFQHKENNATERRYAVYTPIRVGDSFWSVAVISSEKLLLPSLRTVGNQILGLGLVLLFIFSVIGYVAARSQSASIEEQKRREIQAELIKSAEEALDLYNNAPCGYQSLNSDGLIIRINDTELKWLGYKREELLGKPFVEILTEETRESFYQAFAKLKEQGFVLNVEYEMRRKDGSAFPVLVNVSAVTDQAGKFVMSRSMLVDMTIQKDQERRLRESETLYRTVMENTNDGVIITQEGRYVYVNRKFMQTLGRPDDTMIGKQIGAHIHPEDRKMARANYLARERGETIPYANYDLRIIKPDQSTSILNVTVAEIVYQEKPSLFSFIREITELRRAEEALRLSEEKYRTILESIAEEYFETDLAGNITFINKHQSFCGYLREDFLGMNFTQYTKPELVEEIRRQFEKVYKEGNSALIQNMEVIHTDGRIIYLEMTVSLLCDESGEVIGFRGVARDMTATRKAEEEKQRLAVQLHHAQKMEAVGTLAGGVAHDFNNLLMGIQGYTSLLLMDSDKTNADCERLEAIQTLVKSGAELTKQLLGFARVGRYKIQPVNLNDLLRKSINLFGRTRKEISIFENYDEKIEAVEADRGQMEQVFLNLFVNAWQAMPKGGALYLKTENVALDATFSNLFTVNPGRYVKVSVTDTGIGIDEKIQQRIFDPFFTTKEMGRGTGLGLASVYGIIKSHAGYINVSSAPGQGATFSVYLPASSQEAVMQESPSARLLRGSETILLIDDERVIADVTSRLLEQLGYTVIAANSGREAIEIYVNQKKIIDLVIMDMVMPEMSGSEAIDALVAINPNVRIIVSSGYSVEEHTQAISDGKDRFYLQKPYQIGELSQKIREAIGSSTRT